MTTDIEYNEETSFEAILETLDYLDDDDFEEFLLGYEEIPVLLVDTDPDRAIARQLELMATIFEPIEEERKAEKRMGLAMQQLDIEQRHALRLLLSYEEPATLIEHLKRCLANPDYGYGPNGDQGRTIAQAMTACSDDGDLSSVAMAWLEMHRDLQTRILDGTPFSFRSLFDHADLESFVPLVQRIDDKVWRLGVEGEGRFRDFIGALPDIWFELGQTYVAWSEADNEAWLNQTKQAMTRLPDSIFRVAQAEVLRKEINTVTLDGPRLVLSRQPDGQSWPRSVFSYNEGTPQLALSRLSGHAFYELSWAGGMHLRRFELSSTTRHRIPFEHIELALAMATVIGQEEGLTSEPVTGEAVEAAYLRRLKATTVTLGPPLPDVTLPTGVTGQVVAAYTVGDIVAHLLKDSEVLVWVTYQDNKTEGVALQRLEKRGVVAAMPVRRGRLQRGQPLMTTPLDELDLGNPAHSRALCAWGAWLTKVTLG